eukprot:CAMPEP_0202711592 /NCGR_PEP_ID=MMETSP1385-20130828/23347_1 /ASSEMBLY_ACC=CAM_ASM_000861 /TAXON_ID=933848 /ORGANISM="Elphidium margaritaceum" /LENGTH=381 /DNA_ID=CAMNT_0049371345 /DNA_START=74 /DNA_END=1219 /DNA_ORIENTATION=-
MPLFFKRHPNTHGVTINDAAYTNNSDATQPLLPKKATPQNSQDYGASNQEDQQQSFCEWLRTDTLHKLRYSYFMVAVFIPPIVAILYYVFDESKLIYVIIGIYGCLTSLYAMNHFRLLIGLRNNIDNLQALNSTFKYERTAINVSVHELQKGRYLLQDTQQKLHENNVRMMETLQSFEALQHQMRTLNVANVEQISEIGQKSQTLREKLYGNTFFQHRQILWGIFDRIERLGNVKGITRQEYNEFERLLPEQHRGRFQRTGGFDGLLRMSGSQGRDYIDADDFTQALDVYATMMVEDCDITFKIESVKSAPKVDGDANEPEPELVRRRVTILRKVKTQFASDDIMRSLPLHLDQLGGIQEDQMSASPSLSPMGMRPPLNRT